ncbi:MAG TPA: formate dehydrogenase accessory sulfurtransferase FdhD [Ilumatobacteraceae bacterium]|jgi:FdhD protein
MARRRSETVLVTRIAADASRRREPDELIVEEPMTIQLDGQIVTTTMRTPGHDYELAAGFCLTEGVLGGAPVMGVRYCANGSAVSSEFNVVTVETGGKAPPFNPRLGLTSSSCGLCGSDGIDVLSERLAPIPHGAADDFDLDSFPDVCARVLAGQELFGRTGAVHAAAAFASDGTILVTREDVGRHNAVDKVIGRLLLDRRLPADAGGRPLGLFVSGRASFEMVQKAWAGGFAVLLSVSAPTALAVQTAQRANVMLAGFVRGQRFNVYAPERVAPRTPDALNAQPRSHR